MPGQTLFDSMDTSENGGFWRSDDGLGLILGCSCREIAANHNTRINWLSSREEIHLMQWLKNSRGRGLLLLVWLTQLTSTQCARCSVTWLIQWFQKVTQMLQNSSCQGYAGVLCADLQWVSDRNQAGFVAGWLQSSNVFGRVLMSSVWGYIAARHGFDVVLMVTLASLFVGGLVQLEQICGLTLNENQCGNLVNTKKQLVYIYIPNYSTMDERSI